MATIVIENGKDKGKTIDLNTQEEWVFGRDGNCHVPFEDSLASRRHFSIRRSNDRYSLADLGSRNGIFVNGERVREANLEYGDQVSAGNTIFSFLDDEEAKTRGGLVGQTIGGFRIEQRLGRGGMGTVYRAVQLSLDREVALKILSRKHTRDPRFIKRFVQEARAAGSLNHPSIVEVYDVGEDKGFHFFSMEYLPGGSLEDLLNHTDKLLPIAALSLIRDIARGLQFAESRGIIHRDIKPENLMLDHEARAKICDLGIAVTREAGVTGAAGALGTPHYIAPEQADGKRIDHRADIYSLGCTFYRMLTGRFPFDGETPKEIVRKHRKEKPVPVGELAEEASPRLCRLVEKMMAKNPAMRFANATELLRELEACIAEELGEPVEEVEPDSSLRSNLPRKSSSRSRSRRSTTRRKKVGLKSFLNLSAACLLLIFVARMAYDKLSATHRNPPAANRISQSVEQQPRAKASYNGNQRVRSTSPADGRVTADAGARRAREMDMPVTDILKDSRKKDRAAAHGAAANPGGSQQSANQTGDWDATIASVQQSINAFHFGEAIDHLNSFMKTHTGKREKALADQCIIKTRELAAETFEKVSARVQQHLKKGELDRAAELLRRVSVEWDIAPYSSRAREQLSQIHQVVVKSIR